MINQTYPSELIEHIILDDFSSDDSVEIIKTLIKKYNHKCKFIRNKRNQGICVSQNKILKISKGKYFTSLHDDIWDKNRLKILVSNLEKSDNSDAGIFSNFIQINQKNKIINGPYFPKDFVLPKDIFSVFLTSEKLLLCTPTSIIKTKVLKKIGGYNENLFMEDFDMWLKILLKYNVLYVNKILVKYRSHDKNTSKVHWDKIIQSCYLSIEDIEKKTNLSELQIKALLIKKLSISKQIFIIELKKDSLEAKQICIKLYKNLKRSKLNDIKFINETLDNFLIYVFKRDSISACYTKMILNHKFKKNIILLNILFKIGFFSNRLNYYVLILLKKALN